MESIFFRLNGISSLIGRDSIQLEWEGVRVGMGRDVWDGLTGSCYEKVIGIHAEVVKQGLKGDLTIPRLTTCPNS